MHTLLKSNGNSNVLTTNQRGIITLTKDKKKGFTLVELIAVLAIIAILAATLVPRVSGYITESKKVAIISQAKNVITAYEAARITDGSLDEDSKATTIVNAVPELITADDISKLTAAMPDVTVAKCRDIINGNFTLDNPDKPNLDDNKDTNGTE